MPESREQTEVHIGPQGRVVIPAEIRRILGLEPGTTLIARIEDGRLVLEKRENILARLRSRFAQIPPSVSLANELITERREAAHQKQYITDALNQIYTDHPSSVDPTVTQMQLASVPREDW